MVLELEAVGKIRQLTCGWEEILGSNMYIVNTDNVRYVNIALWGLGVAGKLHECMHTHMHASTHKNTKTHMDTYV